MGLRMPTGRAMPNARGLGRAGGPVRLPWSVASRDRPRRCVRGWRSQGFTLLELMIVLTLILIMASMAAPTYHVAVVRAREAVLRDDLFTMRKLIDEYTLDKQKPPSSLQDLVDAGYLRGGIPVDPFTGSNQTWHEDIDQVPMGADQSEQGVVDVHSGSDEVALDGTQYSTW